MNVTTELLLGCRMTFIVVLVQSILDISAQKFCTNFSIVVYFGVLYFRNNMILSHTLSIYPTLAAVLPFSRLSLPTRQLCHPTGWQKPWHQESALAVVAQELFMCDYFILTYVCASRFLPRLFASFPRSPIGPSQLEASPYFCRTGRGNRALKP